LTTEFLKCLHEVRNIKLIDDSKETIHYMTSCESCAIIFKEIGFIEMIKIAPGIVN